MDVQSDVRPLGARPMVLLVLGLLVLGGLIPGSAARPLPAGDAPSPALGHLSGSIRSLASPGVPPPAEVRSGTTRPGSTSPLGIPYSTINVANSPLGGVYDPADGYLYVSSSGSNTVTILNGTSIVGTIYVSTNPSAAPEGGTYDPTTRMVDIVDRGAGTVTFLDGTNVNGSVSVGRQPYGAAFDGQDQEVYVANYGSNNVTILRGTHTVGSIALPAGAAPVAAAYDPADSTIYVSDYGLNAVSILSGTSLLATVSVGTEPGDLAFDDANQEMYVTGSISDNVTILQSGAVVGNLPLGYPVWGAAYDPANQLIYVTDNLTDNLTGISGSRVVGTLPTELGPYSVAYDGTNGCIYVINEFSGTVDVLSTSLLLGPLASSPTGDPANSTDLGETVSLNASVSGNQSWVYQAALAAPAGLGCSNPPSLSISQGSVSAPCAPTAPGTYGATLFVNATGRISVQSALTVVVFPKFTLGLPVATEGGVSGAPGADVGLTVTWNLTPIGGTGRYTSVSWTGFPSGDCVGLTAPVPSCVFHRTGTINVYVTATDTNGAIAYSAGLPFTIDTPPVATPPTADRTTADVGQIVHFATTASGGSGTYSYRWLGVPSNCSKTTVPELACAPTSTGIFQVAVQVTDSFGGSSQATTAVGLAIFSDPVAQAPIATPSTVSTNEPFTVTVNVSGGVATNETIIWLGLPKGCGATSNSQSQLLNTTLTCRTLYPGTYRVFVRVTDGDGFQVVSPTTEIVVTGNPPSDNGGNGSGSTIFGLAPAVLYAALGAGIALVVVAIAVLALRRRPSAPEPEGPTEEGGEGDEPGPGPDDGEEASLEPGPDGYGPADGTEEGDLPVEELPPEAASPAEADEGAW